MITAEQLGGNLVGAILFALMQMMIVAILWVNLRDTREGKILFFSLFAVSIFIGIIILLLKFYLNP